MKKLILSALVMLLLLPVAAFSAKAEEPAAPKNMKIILRDGTVITGAVAGRTDTSFFIEQKDGKAVEVNKFDIKAAFNADTGEEIQLPGSSKKAFTPVPNKTETAVKSISGEKNAVPGADGTTAFKSYTEIYIYASLMNSFAIGTPLQTWFGDDIQSGSPAFFNAGGTMFMGMDAENAMFIGVGMSLNIPPSHSIWGSEIMWGGKNELVLDPFILSLDLPFRIGFRELEGLSITVAPSLLICFLSGDLDWYGNISLPSGTLYGPATYKANMGSMGMGFGISAGAEYYFGIFGAGAKLGYRILSADLNFDSTLGPWSPVDGTGKTIGIDLGGMYATIGLMIKLGD